VCLIDSGNFVVLSFDEYIFLGNNHARCSQILLVVVYFEGILQHSYMPIHVFLSPVQQDKLQVVYCKTLLILGLYLRFSCAGIK
jgi:hypothetical protein